MVQYANNYGDKRVAKVLSLTPEENGALASLLYMVAGGEIDTASLAPNDRDVLLQMYADAYHRGAVANTGLAPHS